MIEQYLRAGAPSGSRHRGQVLPFATNHTDSKLPAARVRGQANCLRASTVV